VAICSDISAMLKAFQWLARFDDRSLTDEVWVEKMLAAVISYNEASNASLNAKDTVKEYLKWDAIIRSKEATRRLWEAINESSD